LHSPTFVIVSGVTEGATQSNPRCVAVALAVVLALCHSEAKRGIPFETTPLPAERGQLSEQVVEIEARTNDRNRLQVHILSLVYCEEQAGLTGLYWQLWEV